MSFAYVATPGGKESLQSFGVVVAIFSEEGSVVGVGIVVWYAFGRESAIMGLRTSSGLESQRLVKRVVLRDGRKNP